jgi:hypothetical protein
VFLYSVYDFWPKFHMKDFIARATWPTNSIILYLSTIMFWEKFKLWSSSLCNFLPSCYLSFMCAGSQHSFPKHVQSFVVVQSCLLGCTGLSLMMQAVRTSETSVDNHFTRQYNPEDSSEHHTRRRENLKCHTFDLCYSLKAKDQVSRPKLGRKRQVVLSCYTIGSTP